MQDTSKIKEKIISTIQQNGPSLPVKLASELHLSTLFASAFLSELLSEKKIKLSNLRVGNSPLYLISGQEPQLENFAEHLKSKEKEAFMLLKENNFLKDIYQEPAIRIALRAIKDFAMPFEKDNELFWRYFTIPESEFNQEKESLKVEEISKKEIEPELNKEIVEENKKEISEKKKISKKKISKKKDDKFFNKVKEFLEEKSVEIIGIEGVSQSDITLKVNENGVEKLIVAYDKKRITDIEIIKANKKAEELGLKYSILSLGEPAKKMQNLIDAIKNLSEIQNITK